MLAALQPNFLATCEYVNLSNSGQSTVQPDKETVNKINIDMVLVMLIILVSP